jgi:hypothetical protein
VERTFVENKNRASRPLSLRTLVVINGLGKRLIETVIVYIMDVSRYGTAYRRAHR